MPKHQEKRALPFRPEQLFDLVADIPRYPEFLPWCKGARILKRERLPLSQNTGRDKLRTGADVSEWQVTADLIIGYKMFREKFASIVKLDCPRAISVTYLSGPLTHLKNDWQFKPDGKGGCVLSFHVDFDFHSRLLGGMMEMFFEKAISRMAAAFEKRAGELYREE